MIILEEATTEQLIEEIEKRSEYLAILVSRPDNNHEFVTKFKGNHIVQMGMVNILQKEIYAKEMYYQTERLKEMDSDDDEEDFI